MLFYDSSQKSFVQFSICIKFPEECNKISNHRLMHSIHGQCLRLFQYSSNVASIRYYPLKNVKSNVAVTTSTFCIKFNLVSFKSIEIIINPKSISIITLLMDIAQNSIVHCGTHDERLF